MVRTMPAAIVHTMERASGALACGSGGGGFPGRAVEAVDKRPERRGLVFCRQKSFVETIEPAPRCLEPVVWSRSSLASRL
jgi:hypothetical protein